MTNCKNCNTILNGNFCSTCGQPAKIKRIDGHYISHEIQHLLHFEKGIFFTVRELLLRPGHTIKEFITENRIRLIKPIPFLIFSSLIYTLIAHYFHTEENYSNTLNKMYGKSSIGPIFHWVQTHYGYANILMGGFIALWITIFFKKYSYNIFEITILLCFVMGMGMLLVSVGAFLEGLFHSPNAFLVMFIMTLIYVCWGIGQFFDQKKIFNYVKAVLAYGLGFLTFEIAVFIVGLTYDVVKYLLK